MRRLRLLAFVVALAGCATIPRQAARPTLGEAAKWTDSAGAQCHSWEMSCSSTLLANHPNKVTCYCFDRHLSEPEAAATIDPEPTWTLPPGALASVGSLPPLHLGVFGATFESGGNGGCSPGGVCLVGSLTSSGAISGTTVAGTTFTSSVASGSDAFVMTNSGARICLLGACSTRILIDATNQIGFYIANAQVLKLNAGTGAHTAPVGYFYSSEAASGANGFQLTTNGARVDYGPGGTDHANANTGGTGVDFAGSLSVASGSVFNWALADSHSYIYRSAANTLRLGTSAGGGSLIISNALTVDGTTTMTGAATATTSLSLGTTLAFAATAPTITSACTSPTVTHGGAVSFQVDVGGTCAATTTIVLGLPAATNGWACTGYNKSTATATIEQSADSTTSATLINYTRTTGIALAFADGTDLVISCTGR